jgi:hypothetical protein
MDTRIETLTADNGATLELATIIHEGHEYTAHGAILDFDQGYVVAYVDEDVPPKTGAGWGRKNRQYAYSGRLIDWSGKTIGRWYETSRWEKCGSWECQTMRSIRATLDGDSRQWIGRYGCDWGQAVTLRPSRAH